MKWDIEMKVSTFEFLVQIAITGLISFFTSLIVVLALNS